MEQFAIILAGGRGERFWPASRYMKPKQLLRLISDKTMLEETISRVEGFIPHENVMIVTGTHLKTLIEKEITLLTDNNFFIEPEGKNTAPAIGFAAAKIAALHGDGVMFVLSSDHLINPVSTFIDAMKAAESVARNDDVLMLIGVEPSRPETGYGYIEMGIEMHKMNGLVAYQVKSFKEKPNHLKAQEYYLDSRHLWNSGIFVWRAKTILEEISIHLPELYDVLEKYMSIVGKPEENEFIESAFKEIAPISIDYGVLEKTPNVGVLRAKFRWDDVGDYAALERILEKNNDGNVITGNDVLVLESYETTVVNESEGAVVALGVSDLVIVREDDVVFVLQKTRISQMRELLRTIKEEGLEKYL